jgi:hypothetical protein
LLNYHVRELTPDDVVEFRKESALEVEKPKPGTKKRIVTVTTLTERLGQATRCLRTLIRTAILDKECLPVIRKF